MIKVDMFQAELDIVENWNFLCIARNSVSPYSDIDVNVDIIETLEGRL